VASNSSLEYTGKGGLHRLAGKLQVRKFRAKKFDRPQIVGRFGLRAVEKGEVRRFGRASQREFEPKDQPCRSASKQETR